MPFDACFIAFNELSTDARTLNMARTIARHGKSVCVIAIGTTDEREKYEAENIHFIPVAKPEAGRAWKRILQFRAAVSKIDVSAKNYIAEDVYTLSLGAKLAKQHAGKVIYDSREIFSALGPLAKNPFKQKILAWLEKRWVKRVDEFIVSGALDAKYLREYFRTKSPFHVVMNLPPYKPVVQSNKIQKKFNIPQEKKILLYQGMLLPGRGLLPAVRALKYSENVVLCLFGEGDFKEQIKIETEKLRVTDRVVFCGSVPYDELHEYTCSADIGLVFIEPVSFSYRLALPNKLFEYCMAGIPSFVTDLPALRDILEKHNIGRLISPGSKPEEIAIAINELLQEKEEYKKACTEASKLLCYESQGDLIMSIFGEDEVINVINT